MQEFGESKLKEKFNFDFSDPVDFSVDIKKLKEFISKDENATIIFYGGEPLLKIGKIKEIIDAIDVPFRMQTNGKLLNELPIEYLNKIDKILVSIDGDCERTDYNRGEGTYDLVVKNLQDARSRGYKGEIIARMTISPEFPDLYSQAIYLLDNEDFKFDSVHWQIDAGFYEHDFDKKKFTKFVKEYNKNVSKLIDYWVGEMSKGKFLKLYPFLDIVYDLLLERETKLRCGAGHSGYAITTSGKVVACPIMNCIKEFEAGNLDFHFENLGKFEVSGECLKCDYLKLCGGRCLYWNKTILWPVEGNKLICDTIKHLIDELRERIPEIKKLIEQRKVFMWDFKTERYFGPEIIP